jgi:hypothetical protein
MKTTHKFALSAVAAAMLLGIPLAESIEKFSGKSQGALRTMHINAAPDQSGLPHRFNAGTGSICA